MKKYFAAASLLLALTACGGGNTALEGTAWKLAQMEGISAEAINSEVDAFTINFSVADTMVFGRTNCNRVFGRYQRDGAKLEFAQMGMTRMACPNMEAEDLFVKMLDEVDGFSIKGTELTLLDDKKPLATFVAQSGEEATAPKQ